MHSAYENVQKELGKHIGEAHSTLKLCVAEIPKTTDESTSMGMMTLLSWE
jgi:hypothetical protein